MSPLIRSLLSAMTLVLIVLYGISLPPAPLAWGSLIALASVYLVMIWFPLDRWTRARYVLAAGLVIGLVGTLLLSHLGGSDLLGDLLLVPLILLLGREQGEPRRAAMLLAALALAAMFAMASGAPYIWTLLPVVAALYMSVRAINIYKQAYQLSQQNVEALKAAHRELQETHEDLQKATVHSMRYAALAERARLAREIHDGLGHQLTSLIVQLQALEIMLPGDPQRASQAVPAILAAARGAMVEVRRAVETWREYESEVGLAALQGLVSQYAAISPFTPEFQPEGEFSEWPDALSVALYRILQEALTNITRHAGASAASIRVQEVDDHVLMTVSDNGTYTEEMPLTPGYGIKGILERSQALGGTCILSQNQPHGLKLQVSLPIAPPAALPAKPWPEWRSAHG